MKLAKIMLFSLIVLLLGTTMSSAQSVTNSYGEKHNCGLRTASHAFTAPKGTVSYYDFISQLGTYFKENTGYYSINFNYYDADANEYHNAPTVAFILETFFSLEIGSTHRGAGNGNVLFLIRAYDCNDLVLNKVDGNKQFIAQITAHLSLMNYAEPSSERAATYIGELGQTFTEALAHNKKILVIARPFAFSTFSIGDRINYIDIEFVIEDYRVL